MHFSFLTGNDVIIPGKVNIFAGTSTQIIFIGLMNICAKFGAFSTICKIFSPFPYTIKSFHDTVNFHLDEMAPDQEVPIKELKLMLKPWITKEILSKCDKRDELLKKFKNEKNPANAVQLYKEYKTLRNQITADKRRGKKAHNIAQFEKNKNSISTVWKSIRSLVNTKFCQNSTISFCGTSTIHCGHLEQM